MFHLFILFSKSCHVKSASFDVVSPEIVVVVVVVPKRPAVLVAGVAPNDIPLAAGFVVVVTAAGLAANSPDAVDTGSLLAPKDVVVEL